MIDLTNCEQDIFKVYDGANGNKICLVYNGEKYMVKFPPVAKKNKELSYTNSCISEHLASAIYKTLGIPVQETFLAKYTRNGKNKMVVACKDFCQNNHVELVSFAKVKNSCVDSSSNGYGTELSSIMDAIEEQSLVDVLLVKERFWEMFAADTFLGNFDRHNGNWGFLIDKERETAALAPVYDNESCLYPQLTTEQMKSIMESEQETDNRIYVFPTSAIKENDKKINYKSFLMSTSNEECLRAFVKISKRIDWQKINKIIDELPVPEVYKQFYSYMLFHRKEKIVDVVMERIKEYGKNGFSKK